VRKKARRMSQVVSVEGVASGREEEFEVVAEVMVVPRENEIGERAAGGAWFGGAIGGL
jgi:hypothetical protein